MIISTHGNSETGYFVRLIHDNELYDEAGPFDDELDAMEAAERAVRITEDW